MPLPEPILDDLRFQRDLVDEARRRIIRYCPEWTDYNVSDPGITLIELFAWMTEMIVYRLNLVPEKNHIKFMELLGFHPVHFDARLPETQGALHVVCHQALRLRVVGREDQLPDAAAKFRAHDALAGHGPQDNANGLFDVVLAGGQGDLAARAELEWEGQPLAEKLRISLVTHATSHPSHPRLAGERDRQ